jgi:Ca-activated chloride channel family protein
LYEVVPVGAKSDPATSAPAVDALKYQGAGTSSSPGRATTAGSGEMLTVKLRHKQPDSDSSAVTERSISAEVPEFSDAPADFRFAAAVAQFGMILRDSPHKGNGTLAGVFELAAAAKGPDDSGSRAGFVELVRTAQTLAF